MYDAAYDYTSIPEGESELCDKIVQAFENGTCTINPGMIVIYGEPNYDFPDVDDDSIYSLKGMTILVCTTIIVLIIVAILVHQLSMYQKKKKEQETKEKDLTMVQTNRIKSMSST